MELKNIRVILASKSPRRRELLSDLVSEFEIITKEVDEALPPEIHPQRGVELLAVRKGAAVAVELDPSCLVISSDTLVELGGVPLGKPSCEGEACEMLALLSGKTHSVHTGVAVHYRGRVFSGVSTSGVRFKQLTREIIEAYVATGEPMDKAGAYGIQGKGGALVAEYTGEFDTIVGLSRSLTLKLINEAIGACDD